MTDALTIRLADDFDGTFAELVDTHGPMVLTLASRLTDPPTGEDLTQDVFLRAYRALGGYASDRIIGLDLRPWLATITRNLVRNEYQRRGRKGTVPLGDTDDATPDNAGGSLETVASRERILSMIDAERSTPAPTHNLAQLNVARFNQPMDHPDMAGFVEMLDPINNLADACSGLLWRLTGEGSNDATSITFYDDPLLLVNLSVWSDLDSLRDFVYRGNHSAMVKRRAEWATAMESRYMVLWWVPAGHRPGVAEADARLKMLDENGPSPDAFTFGRSFPSPT